jgi:predicted AAA+ superfamily ATPase
MISRYLSLLNYINKSASVLLLGPRGTGKTALMRYELQNHASVIAIDLLHGHEYQRSSRLVMIILIFLKYACALHREGMLRTGYSLFLGRTLW